MLTKFLYFLSGCAIGIIVSLILTSKTRSSGHDAEPVAIVWGEAMYEEQIQPSVQGQLQRARQQEFDFERTTLESAFREKALQMEAKKRDITAERLLAQDVDAKVDNPSEDDMDAFCRARREPDCSQAGSPKTELKETIKREKIKEERDRYLSRLQQESKLTILLDPPRVKISYDPSRLRGSPAAPVTIVEFSDFSCPFCRQVEPTLKQLLTMYGGKTSLAYRDFPLKEIHPQADLAARASRCAAEQGKFWEYHDRLFTGQLSFDFDGFVLNARNLNLDEKRFSSCLKASSHELEIGQDVQIGIRAGVTATPSFFINGVFLEGAQPIASFEKIIDAELSRVEKGRP